MTMSQLIVGVAATLDLIAKAINATLDTQEKKGEVKEETKVDF